MLQSDRPPVSEGRSPACVTAGSGDCAEATGSSNVGVASRARDGSVAGSVVGPVSVGGQKGSAERDCGSRRGNERVSPGYDIDGDGSVLERARGSG